MNEAPRIEDLRTVGFLDAALGRGARRGEGDYAAVATVGADAAGFLYVLDVWVRRAAPSRQISAVFDLHARWDYALFGLETNCFQQLLLLPLEEERKRRRAAGERTARGAPVWQLPVREVHHARAKEMRIASLEPLVANGWLRFAADLPAPFWAQLEAFPHGRCDDAIDALEGAVALARSLHVECRRAPRRASVRTIRNY